MNLRHLLIAYAFFWARWLDRLALSLLTDNERIEVRADFLKAFENMGRKP